jgi:hypothetical protein
MAAEKSDELTDRLKSIPKREAEATVQVKAALYAHISKPEMVFERILELDSVDDIVENEQSPPIDLGLTQTELKCINTLFEDWALSTRMCLVDVWALDLFTRLQRIKKYLPEKEREAIIEQFSFDFYTIYISFTAKINKENPLPQNEYYETGKGQKDCYVITFMEWERRVEILKEKLKPLLRHRIKAISSEAKEISCD